MAQSVSIATATVKFPAGKVFSTSYGDRVNALLVLEDGTEVKLWGNPGDPNLLPLKKGQKVSVIQNQKGGWQLVQQQQTEDTQQPAAPAPSRIAHAPLDADEKRAVAAYIDQLGDLYGYCQRVAVAKNLAQTDEDVRAIATTLFIQATKHFNL